jgi:predicted PurR-regulated permease PerM
MNFDIVRDLFRRLYANTLALSMIVLAVSIFFLAASLTSFNIELSQFQRELPKDLDRVDAQIASAGQLVDKAAASGKKFSKSMNKNISSGINNGISSGLIDLPVNTVANVGEKLTSTAVNTGSQAVGFWTGVKERLMFWQTKKRPASEEASPVR